MVDEDDVHVHVNNYDYIQMFEIFTWIIENKDILIGKYQFKTRTLLVSWNLAASTSSLSLLFSICISTRVLDTCKYK